MARDGFSLENLARALEHSGDSVVITDADLHRPGPRILYVNATYERLTGYAADEVIGRSPRHVQGPETDRRLLDDLKSTLAAGRPFHGETINYRKNGTPYWVEWDISPVRDDAGNVCAFISFQRDISHRKSTEAELARSLDELQRSNQNLRDFASVVSHDLQDPLNTVRGYIDLIRHTLPAGAPQVRYAETALDATDRMVQRIRNLLDQARNSDAAARRQPVDLGQVFRQVVLDLEARILSTDAVIESGELPVIHGNPTQVTQVLQNLVNNALKYRHPDRQPHIHLSARASSLERPGECPLPVWHLTVKDNGLGIEAPHLEQVFQRYDRGALHQAGHGSPEGHGLGLALVQRVMEAHDGRVWVESDVGRGSTFHLLFPAVPSGCGAECEASCSELPSGDWPDEEIFSDSTPAKAEARTSGQAREPV